MPRTKQALPDKAMNDTWRHTKLPRRYFGFNLTLTASQHRDRSPYQESDCPKLGAAQIESGACVSLEIQSMAFRTSPGLAHINAASLLNPLPRTHLCRSGHPLLTYIYNRYYHHLDNNCYYLITLHEPLVTKHISPVTLPVDLSSVYLSLLALSRWLGSQEPPPRQKALPNQDKPSRGLHQ